MLRKRMVNLWARLFQSHKDSGGFPPSATPEMPPANQQGTPSSTTDLYSSDQPIHSRDQDRFNRWPFADRISQTIARRTDFASLVVGIYGIWGDGKSSVLYLL